MRKMATIRKINNIEAIPDADAIECATVGGWKIVVKKNEYNIGDFAIYVEIDAWVPTEIANFLSKGQEPREYEGVKGERLRSVKLRGQISQGLLLPLSTVNILQKHTDVDGDHFIICVNNKNLIVYEDDDISEYLGVVKYEPPIPAQLAGEVKGLFPGYIQKTDQERIQNLSNEFNEWKNSKDVWIVEEKLDGSSLTCFINNGEFGVCSRNLELRYSSTNTLWKTAIAQGIEESIRKTGKNYAFQFELIGEGIQGNPYKIKGHQAHLFDIYDIETGQYLLPDERANLAERVGIKYQVPIIERNVVLTGGIDDLLLSAEGKSQLNASTEREGLVYKNMNKNTSFKCISNRFLLKTGG